MAAPKITLRKAAELRADPRNARTHSPDQVRQLANALLEFGFTSPILVDGADKLDIAAGHGRTEAALLVYAEGGTLRFPNGDPLPAGTVPTLDVSGWTPEQRRAYVVADNRLAELAGWDEGMLREELDALAGADFSLDTIGFDTDALAALAAPPTTEPSGDAVPAGTIKPDTDLDLVPEPPADPVTIRGDVWQLDQHLVGCLDSTTDAARELYGQVDLVATDPPYCSGGFQESGKSSGSVGVRNEQKKVANDRLSTRGYQALMKAAVFAIPSQFFLVFTDWRMWTYLFDLAEGSGAGVRSMIVWNKGNAGMGRGWRAQHELILWGCRASPPYEDGFGGLGNVRTIGRQSNDLHTTQKPVELMRELIRNTPWAKVVADPFGGSGTTLIACEAEGVACRTTELDPAYVDTIVRRWEEATGGQAIHKATGKTFAEIAAERLASA
jgi:DNA modification methylase